jgi:hypothetical protein
MIHKNTFSLQKWFSNEIEALGAFYQKKITLHTPILVRYSILDLEIKIHNGVFKFPDNIFVLTKKEIILYKIFQINTNREKYYLITSIGILIARSFNQKNYQITDLFLETTPGRLIFSINCKKFL